MQSLFVSQETVKISDKNDFRIEPNLLTNRGKRTIFEGLDHPKPFPYWNFVQVFFSNIPYEHSLNKPPVSDENNFKLVKYFHLRRDPF